MVPSEDRSAVTHVPTFVPRIINIAIGSDISPELASEITIAVIAADDCISPVSAAPRRNRTGISHVKTFLPKPPALTSTGAGDDFTEFKED